MSLSRQWKGENGIRYESGLAYSAWAYGSWYSVICSVLGSRGDSLGYLMIYVPVDHEKSTPGCCTDQPAADPCNWMCFRYIMLLECHATGTLG